MSRLALVVAIAACSSRGPESPRTTHVEPTVLSAEDQQRDAARTPLAKSVVGAYSNAPSTDAGFAARWSPDGTRILFASNRDGLPLIYAGETAHPDAPALALTPGTERAPVAQFTRDGKFILFLRDAGADENFAIWRCDPDGGHPTNLTPAGVLHRNEPLLPAKRTDLMFYSAATPSSPEVTLFRQDLAGGAAVVVYKQPLPGALLDVTPDGGRALMAAFKSDDDIVVSEIDTATGRARQVFPAAGARAGIYAASYSADGSRLFVSTDRADGVVLLAVDLATGKELATYRDTVTTSPLAMLAAPTGDVLAIGVDAGTHGELRILDAQTLVLRRAVTVPLGEVYLGAFRNDGRAFSFSLSRPEQPDDPYAVDVATGTVSPLRTEVRPGLAALPPVTVASETARAFDGLAIPINVYLPAHASNARLPVIASFHGGPSASSAIRWAPSIRFYTALGYAVVEPNVRGSTGFGRAYEMADNREKRADWLRDLETVNAWLKTQSWCDPDRIAIFGGSYGGYTVLMALTRQPTAWRAGIDAFGPANLRSFLLSTDAAIRSGFIPEFGDVDKDAALIEEFSPMRDIAKIVRPLFVYAGQNDPRVPRSESDAIVEALRTRHVPVEYVVAPNEGHSVDRAETKVMLMVRTARFLEDAMR